MNNGNIHHALIDTGRKVYEGVVCKFLEKHNVKKLEFLLITHSHGDHNGDTISVIEKYEIGKLIMKEFDLKWSPDGTQKAYEDIVSKAIEKKIKILGISYISLFSEEYSPSRSDKFKNELIKDAKEENFEYFNINNVCFKFGSSIIQIMNWEIFDSEGNLFITGKNNGKKKIYRDIYTNENQNSMGVLLKQGTKKAFFSGDMNNIQKNIGNKKIGDEDRLKNIIGKVDLLKLGHHGYQFSNTMDYLKVLRPEYVIITNDIGEIFIETNEYLEKNNINYLYSTYDEYEVNAVISNDNISLGFGTKGIKKIKNKIFYISEENKYKDYLNLELTINYKPIEQDVKNWEELKKIIENNRKRNESIINKNSLILEQLIINLCCNGNSNLYIANSSLNITGYQKITLKTNEKEIIIKRDKTLIDYPLFYIENSIFNLGEENMVGAIKIDGNKENVLANSNLIKLKSSEFNMFNNSILCNNYNKTVKRTKKSSNINLNKFFGSAVYAIDSKINIYGGEISDNIHEIYIDEKNNESKLPELLDKDLLFCTRGVGLYMINKSILHMYGGKISNNKGINNSFVYTNINATNQKIKNAGINQSCQGIGIYAHKNSEIYLHKGEISKNIAINNAKTFLITPQNGKNTQIFEIFDCIYGSAIYLHSSKFEMLQDFIIKNNSCEINTSINIEQNCSIIKGVHSAIRGGQIYFNNSDIIIKGGLIQNGKNNTKVSKNIFNKEIEKEKKIIVEIIGGGINLLNCKIVQINNLKIEKCNSTSGGAIYFNNCLGRVSDCVFENNFAKGFGGAIFIKNINSDFIFFNNRILNNITEDGSGGGIYAFGSLLIDGANTLISDNIAGTYGGGIMVKNNCIIKGGEISHNRAMKNSGGGIRVDGSLQLINGKISKNWANLNGGGINYEPSKKFSYDMEKIEKIVYKNNAKNDGNEIFPLLK